MCDLCFKHAPRAATHVTPVPPCGRGPVSIHARAQGSERSTTEFTGEAQPTKNAKMQGVL